LLSVENECDSSPDCEDEDVAVDRMVEIEDVVDNDLAIANERKPKRMGILGLLALMARCWGHILGAWVYQEIPSRHGLLLAALQLTGLRMNLPADNFRQAEHLWSIVGVLMNPKFVL
jgi:hypothetical protein